MNFNFHIFYRFIFDAFDQALDSMSTNRFRTFLSVIGISAGIAAVIIVDGVSKGGKEKVFKELETFGLKTVWIFRANDDKNPANAVRIGTGIENADVDAIDQECCPAVAKVSPVTRPRQRYLISYASNYNNASLGGVGITYLSIANDQLLAGRNFNAEDIKHHRPSVIIGLKVMTDLFGESSDAESILGKEIRISDTKFEIIGVLESKSRDFLASIGAGSGDDPNNRILMPYTMLQRFTSTKEINALNAETVEFGNQEEASSQLKAFLSRRHNYNFKYQSGSMAEYVNTANRILDGVSLVGIVAALVSLLVGGLGIMNIMSTSVLERTPEIGLRKAIGGSRADILTQFLLEAMLISVAGGMIGLLFGLGSMALASYFLHLNLFPSSIMIISSLLISLGVGLASGYYPALRAAQLRPVEALRYE